jgi:hypothetical protein
MTEPVRAGHHRAISGNRKHAEGLKVELAPEFSAYILLRVGHQLIDAESHAAKVVVELDFLRKEGAMLPELRGVAALVERIEHRGIEREHLLR